MALIEFKNLPDTSTPLNAENLNYNFNELNNKGVYSTEETIIGTWLGKPLYRKVVDTGSLPNTNSKTIAHNIKDLETMVKLSGIAINPSTSYSLPLPYIDLGNLSWCIQCFSSNEKITIISKDDKTAYSKSYVILEYTKTTD